MSDYTRWDRMKQILPWGEDESSEEESCKNECCDGASDAGYKGESSIEADRNLAKFVTYMEECLF